MTALDREAADAAATRPFYVPALDALRILLALPVSLLVAAGFAYVGIWLVGPRGALMAMPGLFLGGGLYSEIVRRVPALQRDSTRRKLMLSNLRRRFLGETPQTRDRFLPGA